MCRLQGFICTPFYHHSIQTTDSAAASTTNTNINTATATATETAVAIATVVIDTILNFSPLQSFVNFTP